MKTIGDALLIFDDGLKSIYPKDEIESLKYLILSDICDLSKTQLRAFPEKEINDELWQKLNNIIAELQTGKPVQYILGHTEFYGLPFNVNPSVLIPRPETEELVEWIIQSVVSGEWPMNKLEAFRILDIGTGSGCIPISLKKHLPDAQITGLDISTEALQTARQNAELNKVDVEFIEANILNWKDISHLTSHISILISNPPYVTEHEKRDMHTNVLDYEPHTALFVTDNDPLIFYNAIADFALNNLQKDGLLFFEINENLGKQTVDLLNYKGFNNIELRQDMRGKDRMIKAEK